MIIEIFSIYRRHQPGRPIRSRRAVYKSGEENVPVRSNIPAKSMKYMRDIVNTVVRNQSNYLRHNHLHEKTKKCD